MPKFSLVDELPIPIDISTESEFVSGYLPEIEHEKIGASLGQNGGLGLATILVLGCIHNH